MAFDMSTLMPGMNPSGTNQAVPGTSGPGPAMGGANNPFMPSFPSGTSMPGSSNPIFSTGPDANMGGGGGPNNIDWMGGKPAQLTTGAGGGGFDLNTLLQQISQQGFGANGAAPGFGIPGMGGGGGGGGNIPNAFGNNFNLAQSLGFGGAGGNPNQSASGSWAPNQNDFIKAMKKSGFSAGDAALLFNFVQSGGGFNQQAINQVLGSTFAAQQPQINRGEADILEHFGAEGLGMSSPAAIGLGDYLSQVTQQQGALAAQTELGMYEQSISNILNVLMAGKGQPAPGLFQNILGWMNAAGNMAKGVGEGVAGV